ncbi:MAG: hypothetical protein JW827_03220 [Spirochaetes bacterium]|nr:hypothetical protein [Spirochaetota bacterium]
MRRSICPVFIIFFLMVGLINNSLYGYAYKPQKYPVVIYLDGDIWTERSFYAPTCWGGDVLCIQYNQFCTEKPKTGNYCMKFEYNTRRQSVFNWISINWTFPSYNWGNIDGGLDLTGARQLTFYARGKKGDEVVIFKFGGNYGTFSDSTEILYGPVKLTRQWKKYTILLDKEDLTHISLGFSLAMRWMDHKQYRKELVTIYIDEIKIER